ncbi:MAG: DUF1080 domain-containing protein [Cyclobacteriaceae bacterium]
MLLLSRKNVSYILLSFSLILFSCKEEKKDEIDSKPEKSAPEVPTLAMEEMLLNDMSEFKPTSENWQIGGDALSERGIKHNLTLISGKGTVLNLMTKENRGHLFTLMEHEDIDLEIDVMLPKGSNSGIYFHGMYEVQLLDSWGKDKATFSDIGGIYQRWDENRPEGEKGYEGKNPKINAAYAPGLWQNLKISFKAPRFDENGKKLANARFESVRLNGHLVQEDVEVSGPTRAAVLREEKRKGPIMIQGDHGPMAFRNVKYKLYNESKVKLKDVVVSEYQSKDYAIGAYADKEAKYTKSTDSISYLQGIVPHEYMMVYKGSLTIPNSGDYLFNLVQHGNTAGRFGIDGKTIIDNKRGKGRGIYKITLEAGDHSFELIYNHPRKIWAYSSGFELYVEGPQVARHPLHAPSSNFKVDKSVKPIHVSLDNEAEILRSFVMHKGDKLTHCVSVGTPSGYHYTVDLLSGSIVRMWAGRFIDATSMWHSRGQNQLGIALDGPLVELSRSPLIADLSNDNSEWPSIDDKNNSLVFKGYELDEKGLPLFEYHTNRLRIRDKTTPGNAGRSLIRTISLSGDIGDSWLKVADGSKIEQLKDGSFAINDKSYYLVLSDVESSEFKIRTVNEKQELLVALDGIHGEISYQFIW